MVAEPEDRRDPVEVLEPLDEIERVTAPSATRPASRELARVVDRDGERWIPIVMRRIRASIEPRRSVAPDEWRVSLDESNEIDSSDEIVELLSMGAVA